MPNTSALKLCGLENPTGITRLKILARVRMESLSLYQPTRWPQLPQTGTIMRLRKLRGGWVTSKNATVAHARLGLGGKNITGTDRW